MRVTGNSISYSVVSQLNLLAARQARLQQQATSGQRITSPEDDPAAMAQALDLQAEHGRTVQYSQNISTLENRATAASTALQALKKISDRASEIATQANGIQSPEFLQSAAEEVKQLIQDAVRAANARDGGQYVFAGTRSDEAPFSITADDEGTVTSVTYNGNTNAAQSEIAQGATITVDAPGANTSGTGPRGVLTDSRYGADFLNHLISLQNNLMAGDTEAIETTDRAALLKDEDNLIYQTARNGVMLSGLEIAASSADTRQNALQQGLTDVAGADLTETLVQLSQAQNAYQLAVQSSSQLLQLQQSLLGALS